MNSFNFLSKMPSTQPTMAPNKQKGLSLLEILITLLIISVGSLGMAAMQLTSLKYASGANNRTQANLAANSMFDRMRANKEYLRSNGAAYEINSFTGSSSSAKDCHKVNCGPAEIAAFDTAKWLEGVARLLPDGNGKITITRTTAPPVETVVTITVRWRQAVASDNQANADIDIKDELQSLTFASSI